MIGSFTQTYGTDRQIIYKLKEYDENDIYFRKKLDKNFYAFHGTPDNLYRDISERKFIKDVGFEFLKYPSSEPYPKTYLKTLLTLKEKGITYILFLQDDVFSNPSLTKQHFDDLFHIIKNEKFDIINLESNPKSLYTSSVLEDILICQKGDLKLYKTTTEKTLWGDYPFIANIDYLINNVYDEEYFDDKDIWRAEYNLSYRIKNKKILPMFTLNKCFYQREALAGRSNTHAFEKVKKIMEKNLIHKDKDFKFTTDWFSGNVDKSMRKLYQMFKDNKNNILEIGSYEGRSTTWMLQHLCSHDASTLTSVDPYNIGDPKCSVKNNTYEIFSNNIKLCDNFSKFSQIVGYSSSVLPKLIDEEKMYNIIYIDGSHLYKDIVLDLNYSDVLLKNSGVLIIDDVGIENVSGYVDVHKACKEFVSKNTNYTFLLKEYQWMLLKN